MVKFLIKYEGQEVELGEGVYILGRSKECHLIFQGESVSRKHAKLTIMQDRIFIEDIGSSNGSFVNGKLVRGETLVQAEDRIHLGKVVVILKQVEESAELTLINECPNCHTKVSPEINFCIQCGADLRKRFQPVASKASDSTAELPQQKEYEKIEEPITGEHSKESFDIENAPPPPPPPPAPPQPKKEAPRPYPVSLPVAIPPVPPPVIQSAPIPVEAPPEEQRIRMEPYQTERAGFWIRFLAYLLDGVIINLLMLALALLTIVPFILIKVGTDFSSFANNPEIVNSPLFILVIGLWALLTAVASLYYMVHGPAKKGGTLGKRILGLRIYTVDGLTPIGWGKSFLRLIGYWVSGLILYIGFFMIAFREDKRGLHDLIAGTIVIKEKK